MSGFFMYKRNYFPFYLGQKGVIVSTQNAL